MLQSYNDIKNKIDEEPKWFDEVGVPRYCEFDPNKVNDIYAKEVILLLIACQKCGKMFKVAISQDKMNIHKFNSFKNQYHKCIHYGDPPRHSDNIGETMNCIDLEILEYWEQGDTGWERKEDHEGKITKDWEKALNDKSDLIDDFEDN